MAVIDVLPNGYVLVTLTPREATMVHDEILDPGDYPWQGSESQMIALEVKLGLKGAIESIHRGQANMIRQMVMQKIHTAQPVCPNEECAFYRQVVQPDSNACCPNCQTSVVPASDLA